MGTITDRGARQGRQAAAEVPQDRRAEPVRRPEGPHAGAGQVRAARQGHRHRGGDRRRRPADHHDVRPPGDGRRRRTACSRRSPRASATSSCTSARRPSRSAPARVRGFYGGQDYLQSQINWAATGGMAGSTIKPLTVAAGPQAGLLDQGHLRGQLALRVPRRHRGRATRARAPTASATTTASRSSWSRRRGVDQHRLRRHVRLDGRRPAGDLRHGAARSASRARAPRSSTPASPRRPSTSARQDTLITLGKGRVSPINMANAYATIANGGERARRPRRARRSSTRTARRSTSGRPRPARPSTRTSPPTPPTSCSRSSQNGTGQRRPRARPTGRRQDRHRDQRRRTSTSPRRGSPATPRRWPPR